MRKGGWRRVGLGRLTMVLAAACLLASISVAHSAEPWKTFKPIVDGDGRLTVAAVVATEAPYRVDATGKTDVSVALQHALADASAHGGGVVYLPAGRYRLEKNITVPSTVTLAGQWKKPEPGRPLEGTVLLAQADKDRAEAPALISMPECGHANVYNLAIYYPEQNPLKPVPYPFSIDGRVAYVRNITLVNSYQGIMMSGFSGSSVADIYGTVLKRGLVMKSSCELCSCFNLRFASDYWTRLPEAAMTSQAAAAVHQFMLQELTAVQVGKVDGLSFSNASLAESKTPVLVQMEKDEQKVMIAPWACYGFGGGLFKVDGRRTDVDLDAWYFGAHYFNLDNYPQLAGKEYHFAPPRGPTLNVGSASADGIRGYDVNAGAIASANRDPTKSDAYASRSGDTYAVYQATDFGVKADGAFDDSSALQRALDQAAKSGGGTVLLPRGVTLLKAPIRIPAGVELRGGHLGVPIRSWYSKLCTLMIDCDADTSDADHAPAAITLEQRAGLRGMFISHAKNMGDLDSQGKLAACAYPYAIRALGKEACVQDIALTNAWNGIDIGPARCDGAQVVGLWGTMLHDGIRVGGNSDHVQLENINIDIGPMESDPRFARQPGPAAERHKILQAYLGEHAVSFVFGDCTQLSTFDLAGFAPHRFMQFIDQGCGGCRDGQFWSSIFDVPQVDMARFTGGGGITFYGLFTTGGRDHHSLWAEFDDSFHGKVDVYGLCQQLSFNNRPFAVGPGTLQIHLEHSLTAGRPIAASSSAAGYEPKNAIDGDARTLWQSENGNGPHWLTVELAGPSIITRLRVHGAGTFLPAVLNVAKAQLLGSADGSSYFEMASFKDNRQDWVDMPVACDKPVRFVRLQVTEGQGPSASSNCARIAQFDVFGRDAGAPAASH